MNCHASDSNEALVKAGFSEAYAGVFKLLSENQVLAPEELHALEELQTLIAETADTALNSQFAASPGTVEFYYERAGKYRNQGCDEEASQDYLTVLSKDPNHFGTLNDFSALLFKNGKYVLAQKLLTLAVKADSSRAIGHLNLADTLLALTEYEAAKTHYQLALDLDPGMLAAHQGLSLALAGLGDQAGAAAHRESGFRSQAVINWPHRGAGACIPVLILSSAFGGNMPIKHVLDDRIFQSTVILSEYFELATPLPHHKLIINLIGDADLCQAGLDVAETLLVDNTAPVINHPALVRPTGRLENAERLGRLAGVTSPRMLLLKRAALLTPFTENLLTGSGLGFPVLLRSIGFHTGQFFVRVDTPDLLSQAAASLPGEDILAMQLLDTRNSQGDYHKYRVMFVDGILYPLHLAISKHWKVHYFSSSMNLEQEHRQLEAAYLEEMPSVLGAKAMTALDSIRQTLGLDYGGIDFAVDSDGEVMLFEANATMVVPRPEDHIKWAYRRAPTERILEAIKNIIINRTSCL